MESSFLRNALIMLLLPMSSACGDDPVAPAAGEPAIFTNRSFYIARRLEDEGGPDRYGFRVISTFHNTTDGRLWLIPCADPEEGPMWSVVATREPGSAYSTIWPGDCGQGEGIPIDPGGSRTDTIDVRGPTSWSDEAPRGYGAFEGVFRMWYFVSMCRVAVSCDPTAEHLTLSNPFVVVTPIGFPN